MTLAKGEMRCCFDLLLRVRGGRGGGHFAEITVFETDDLRQEIVV